MHLRADLWRMRLFRRLPDFGTDHIELEFRGIGSRANPNGRVLPAGKIRKGSCQINDCCAFSY
jgi:hypothetical protein